jgi:phage gpG-like protein
MGLPETIQFVRLCDNISKSVDRFPNLVAAEAVRFSKQRFREQAWLDTNTENWKKRKDNTWNKKKQRKGRGILIDSGRLFRSIRKIIAQPNLVVIGTDVPYARMHNDGGRFTFNQHVKPFTRSRPGARAARGNRKKALSGTVSVRGFTRTIHINMPRRRFLGGSAVLNRNLERIMASEIIKAAKASV